VAAAASFFDRLQPYVEEWASAAHEQNVVTEHCLHDAAAWVAYLQWYLPRTRTLVTYMPATAPPPLVRTTEDADAGDVRACYRATATCPGPRQGLLDATYPVRRD
jgi:hypothetical protein